MSSNGTSPILRFSEFTCEYTIYKLGQITEIKSASRVLREQWQDSGVPFFRSSDVVAAHKMEKNKKVYIAQELFEELSSKSGRLKKNDLLVTGGGSIGIPYLVKSDEPLYFKDADLICFKSNKTIYGPYLYQFFLSPTFRQYLRKITHTGTISHFTIEQGKATPIRLPATLEQKKIAEFLCKVDKKISLLKEKHALLEQYKKGVVQKLFKQEIRFKDDNGSDFPDWKVVKVANFMEESRIKGSTGDKARKMTVKLWGKGVYEKDDKQGGSANTQYYRRKAGQFIYSKLDFLNCAFGVVPKELDGLETTVDLPCFDIATGTNSYFILEYIKQKRFYKKYGDMADGSRKAKRIHADTFLSFPINLPSKEEQDKIADFLQTIDEKIGLVIKQIELTQTFKKGLLQQMFV